MTSNSAASDFMSSLPFYVTENATLIDVLDKIEMFGLSEIAIIDTKFKVISTISKKEIAQFFIAKKIRKNDARAKDILIKTVLNYSQNPIVAYPNSDINKICEIMELFKLDYIPIVRNPWNKVLIGFVSFSQVQVTLTSIAETIICCL